MNVSPLIQFSGRRALSRGAVAAVSRPHLIAAPSSSSSAITASAPHAASRFMSTTPQLDEDGGGDDNVKGIESLDPSVLANIYNHRRAHYKRSVKALRKRYQAEHAARVERERKRKAYEDAKFKRETLERRRLKAMRSAENARKQLDKRDARLREWEAELAQTQRERDAKKELYRRARQKIADELEAECHLWLTTPEEVEKALGNPTANQVLWSRAGGMMGAPSGPDTGFGDFGDFWRYECHTWDARPTYKDPKEIMLEEIEYLSFLQANNDPRYWSKEKVEEKEKTERRARLRAIVREEGRRSLLNKQREMMRDVYGNDMGMKDDNKGGKLPPSSMPAPKLDYLADFEAQEREGVKIMMEDPRRFFIFENDLPSSSNLVHDAADAGGQDGEDGYPAAASLGGSSGRPVGLRNPFFGDKPTAFPPRVGRDLPADTRTEKEKKRDERQERMRAAAEEAALAAKKGMSYEVAMAAEEDLEDGSEPIDYDKAEEEAEKELWVDEEERWSAADRKVFDMTPPMARLTGDDLDWLTQEVQSRADRIQDRVDFEEKMIRKDMDASMKAGTVTKTIESIDDIDRYIMEGLGYDMDKIEALVRELTQDQASALEDIDFAGRVGITAQEMTQELSVVPGLREDQVRELVRYEMSLLRDERLKNLSKTG